ARRRRAPADGGERPHGGQPRPAPGLRQPAGRPRPETVRGLATGQRPHPGPDDPDAGRGTARHRPGGHRRVWLLSSTEAAAPVVEDVVAVDAALRHELWKGITRAEQRELSQILERLQGNLAAVLND